MQEKPSSEKRFVVDTMLGKMAKWLRVLGFDTRSEHLTQQDQLEFYLAQGFYVVTRNQRWCKHPGVLCVIANDPMRQLQEVISRTSVAPDEVRFLKRCTLCNDLLDQLSRDQAFGLVPDYVFETQSTFFRCPNCQRIYWPGSHPRRMLKRLSDVLGWVL